MAGTDTEIEKHVWGGRIPIIFHLADADAGAQQASQPITAGQSAQQADTSCLLVHRVTYLALCSEKLRQVFKKPAPTGAAAASDEQNQVWYEYNGTPLRWNVPVGVLFDLLADPDALPWNVTVHFSQFPGTQLMSCSTLSVAESHFLARVKEANMLKHGSVQIDGLSSQEDRKQLWAGLILDDFDQFKKVNDKLMTTSTSWFRRFPFRMYALQTKDGRVGPVPQIMQEPYEVMSEDGRPRTLTDLLTFLFDDKAPAQVTIHGLSPPLNTPLQWLAQHLAHPDNFVHIVAQIPA